MKIYNQMKASYEYKKNAKYKIHGYDPLEVEEKDCETLLHVSCLNWLECMQCMSLVTCKKVFSVQNLTKTHVRNRLGSKNLDASLRLHWKRLMKS